MRATRALRWSLSVAALLAVTTAAFVPILFALAKTPLHDGDELPTAPLLAATFVASVAAGAVAAGLVHRLLRGPRQRGEPD